ncbi:MAG: 2-phospho-L-lactate guanylyltransferase [Burkholderiales bacterium]
MPGTWAVVPVKEAALAKSRLAPDLPAEARVALVRAMLEDVLAALAAVRGLAGIAVVTVDSVATHLAARHGARVLREGARDGHTGAVTAAARLLERESCGTMITIPGDVPAASAEEVERVLAAHGRAPAFTIVPAHDRQGSNAVAVSPPTAVPLAFGNASFTPHLEAARRCAVEPVVVEHAPGLARDVDRREDLVALLGLPGAHATKRALRDLMHQGGLIRLHDANA